MLKLVKGHFLCALRVASNFISVTWQECNEEVKTIVFRITDKPRFKEKVVGPFSVRITLRNCQTDFDILKIIPIK